MSVFTADFSTNHSGSIIGETSSPFLLLLWVAIAGDDAKKQSNKPMSGARSPSCRPGSVQLNLWKNMKRQTDPYGVLTQTDYVAN